MTRKELAEQIAEVIADVEGYRVKTSLAYRNANPGNIRHWRDATGRPYPISRGFVSFVMWAAMQEPLGTMEDTRSRAEAEGWRVLRTLVEHYLRGQYTGGKVPSLREMFHVYAPAADSNDPDHYAKHVASKIGVDVDQKLVTT